MNHAYQDYIRPGHEAQPPRGFPFAPMDWSLTNAKKVADMEGITLTQEYWRVVRALQDFYAHHEAPTMSARTLHDALDENFHALGGIKYLYKLFPKGPLAQGCLLAGLQPPGGSRDKGFGSAV